MMSLGDSRRTNTYFLFLIIYASLLFFVGIGHRPLLGPDELRVAGIAAEMEMSGDLVVPRLNGEPFLEKPPLYFWALSAIFNLFGENSYAARIPSALAAVSGVALVFIFVRSIGSSPLSALIAGFILATSAEYFSLGRRCLIDMMLCLFTTSAILCFFHANRFLPRRFLWYIGFVLSLSCAVLTKGLVGLAIPSSAVFIWLLVNKNFSRRAWYLLLIGSALSFIPAAIWIWFLYNELGWNAVYEIAWKNNFGRFTGSYHEHVAPFWYYLQEFPLQFFPWTIFLPTAFIHYLRERGEPKKEGFFLLPLAWFAVPFLLLSVSAGKRGLYLLPLYPAAAILVGTAVGASLEGKKAPTQWLSIPSQILAAVTILVPLAFVGLCIYSKRCFWVWPLLSLPGFCLGLWAYSLVTRKDLTGFFKTVMMPLLVLYLTFDIGLTAPFDQRNSHEPLFEYCKRLDSEGVQLGLFRPSERIRGAAVFYLRKTLPVYKDEKNLKNFLYSGKRVVAISEKQRLEEPDNFDVMKCFKIGHKAYVLVTDNDPDREKR
jgi:4-amino-4-deoxy-L-arabinose transferase-like glycosyltransferase